MDFLLSEASRFFQTQPGPSQWLDWETLCTAPGSTTAVLAVTAVLQRLWPKFQPKWFALGLSLVLPLLCIKVHCQKWNGPNIFLALLNGIITYSACVGINTIFTTSTAVPTPGVVHRTYRWWH